ncbi:MAG TPA: terminase small subunit, partial [Leptolyngbyaceae cyanobacterium]
LLKDPLFQRHLAALMKQREKRTQVTQDAIIEEFRRVAFANITDVAEWQKGDVQFRASTDISPDVTPAIAEVSSTWTENGRQLKVKMHPKMDALKVLAQHVGLTMPMQTAISSLRRYGIYLNQKEDGTYELLDVYQSAAQDSLEDFDDEDLLGESALDEDELEDELTEE